MLLAALLVVVAVAADADWNAYFPPSSAFQSALFQDYLDVFLSQPKIATSLFPVQQVYESNHVSNVDAVMSVLNSNKDIDIALKRQSLIDFLVPQHATMEALERLGNYSKKHILPALFNRYMGIYQPSTLSKSTVEYFALVLGVKVLHVTGINLNSSSKHVINHLTLLDPWFTSRFKGYKRINTTTTSVKTSTALQTNNNIPNAINWVELGAVGPVLNQGSCGGCWAFAAMQVLASRFYISPPYNNNQQQPGVLTSLSIQQVLSCAYQGQNGCSGGDPQQAWEYLMQANGATSESLYPYVNAKGGPTPPCAFNGSDGIVTTSWYPTQLYSEQAIMQALAEGGPIVIGIATPSCFESYSSGVLMQKDCACYQGPSSVDHAVVIVGYGTTSQGVDYWLCKNSWGPAWGMDGFFMLERNVGGMGMCGLLTEATYPIDMTFTEACSNQQTPASFCSTAAQPPGYTSVNVTSGEQMNMCVENNAGPYADAKCKERIPSRGVRNAVAAAWNKILIVAVVVMVCLVE